MNNGGKMALHYRKDNPQGVTAPNPDAEKDIVAHITKRRGHKTPYTSVSEDEKAIEHISGGALYKTESDDVVQDSHSFITHSELLDHLRKIGMSSHKGERIKVSRALQYAFRAKEALIDWQFNLESIDRKDRIAWCSRHIQKYFRKVWT
jgi:hypothetical protein